MRAGLKLHGGQPLPELRLQEEQRVPVRSSFLGGSAGVLGTAATAARRHRTLGARRLRILRTGLAFGDRALRTGSPQTSIGGNNLGRQLLGFESHLITSWGNPSRANPPGRGREGLLGARAALDSMNVIIRPKAVTGA